MVSSWEVRDSYPLGPWVNRLLATLALVTLVAVIWGVRLSRRLREADELAQDMESQQSDPIQESIDQQETSLNSVLSEIIDSVGGGDSSRYRLPWYLVMGVENAGKTSLVNRSGQNFALSNVMKASGISSKKTALVLTGGLAIKRYSSTLMVSY